MRNPDGLYELVEELPELGQPVLIQALSGFIDAGGGVRLAREHLLETGSPTTVARFDLDQLLDYRSRRPTMLFVEDHWESYEELSLSLHLLHDRAGTPYLLLTGPEPDLRWEGFTTAVIQLVERLGVRLTVGLGSIPMAVPHTRPTGVTAHATRPELILERQPWRHRVQVPATTRSGSSHTCRTTWLRATIRRRRRPCCTGCPAPPGWCCPLRSSTGPPTPCG